ARLVVRPVNRAQVVLAQRSDTNGAHADGAGRIDAFLVAAYVPAVPRPHAGLADRLFDESAVWLGAVTFVRLAVRADDDVKLFGQAAQPLGEGLQSGRRLAAVGLHRIVGRWLNDDDDAFGNLAQTFEA